MRLARLTVLTASAALALSAAGLMPAAAATSTVSMPDSQFYVPPATLPAGNGVLIRQQPTSLGLSFSMPGMSGPLPGRATKIMYTSTDTNGQRVAVTGAYFEPTAAWTGSGPRPIVSVASGTIGQGDQCAPSRNLTSPVNITGASLSINYALIDVYGLLARGVGVVMTDYVGLGTTDRLHTYVNRVDEGHAVLDGVRAARSVVGATPTASSKVGVYGYSQGGGAAASAAELAPSYAPDVKLAGAYAGAPPADLMAVLRGIDGTMLTGAIGWSINGFNQTYPALKTLVDTNTTPAGKTALAKLSTMCVGDAVGAYAFAKTSSWTTSGQSLASIIAGNPQAVAVMNAQRIGTLKPTAPVRIISGTADDLVAHGQARALAATWCGKGVNVTYQPYLQTPTGGTGVDHLGPYIQDYLAAHGWMLDRLRGKTAISNCWSMPVQP